MNDLFEKKNGMRVHPEGWGVKFSGPEIMVYCEGEREVAFEFFVDDQDAITVIPITPKRWDEPHHREVISDGDWRKIIERLKVYIDWRGDWGTYQIKDGA